MGISLLSCCDPDAARACEKIYDKITRCAEKLVATGEDIEREFGIPIVNKRISVTPMAPGGRCQRTEDYVPFAWRWTGRPGTAASTSSAATPPLVQKGMTAADERLIRSIPEALARTELVCSSVNVGSTRAGINMDAVALMGRVIKEDCRRHGGPGRPGLREAGGVLQRRGGQPLHGRRLPRRGRGGEGHQRGLLRPRRGCTTPSRA